MRKPWLYKRKNRPGWYVRWYGRNGKQHSKRLPNKPLAEQFKYRLQHQMNEDVYVDPLKLPWDDLIAEYLDYKTNIKNLAAGSIESAFYVFRNMRRICGPLVSTQVNQKAIQDYISGRTKEGISPATVNKDLRTIRTMVGWAVKNRYMGHDAKVIDWSDVRQPEQERPVRALTVTEFARLLATAGKLYGQSWQVRLILAVASGLRQGDIESLHVSDIRPATCSLTTRSRKTGKASGNRPIHPAAARILGRYIKSLPPEQSDLFADKYHWTKWKRVTEHAKVKDFTFHDLRRSFASFILQAGHSTSVV